MHATLMGCLAGAGDACSPSQLAGSWPASLPVLAAVVTLRAACVYHVDVSCPAMSCPGWPARPAQLEQGLAMGCSYQRTKSCCMLIADA